MPFFNRVLPCKIRDVTITRFILNRLIIFILPVLFLFPGPVSSKDLLSVLDLQTDNSVSQATIDTVCEHICRTVALDKRFEVFDRRFLPFTLQNIGMSEHPRCAQLNCFTAIGKGIGTKYIIGGTIKVVNKVLMVTLNYVDAENGVLLGTVTRKYSVSRSEFIQQRLPSLVQNLVNMETIKMASVNKGVSATKLETSGKKTIQSSPYPVAPEKIQYPVDTLADNIKKTNKKEPSSTIAIKKKNPAIPIAIISASAVTVGAAVVYYLMFYKGPGAQGDNGMSLDDAPQHTR
jgi:hypothetical protein